MGNKLKLYIRERDLLVVTELNRMSRSLLYLLEIMEEFKKKEINLRSLRENIDTISPTGRAFISIMGAISQMELEIGAERARDGRIAAKAQGKSGGRPRIDPKKLEEAKILYQNSNKSSTEICRMFGFSKRTFFAYIKKQKMKYY